MSKNFLVFLIFFIASCGGGSGSVTKNNSNSFVNPVINNFSSNKYNLTTNQSFNISWSASANSCSASGSGDWTGEKEITGNETHSFSINGTYVLILNCYGGEGTIIARSSISIYVSDDGSYKSFCKTPSKDSNEYWLEEFNNPRLDSDVFSYQIGSGFFDGNGTWIDGWGNNEPQYYTGPGFGQYGNYAKNYNSESNTTENLFIEDGYLKIQPIYNEQHPFLDPYDGTTPKAHTSAKLITSDKKVFELPAKITVCFKVPDGTGFWPAIWMLPQGFMDYTKVWPDDGEIDLMEARGRLSQVIGSTIHFKSNGGRDLISHEFNVEMAQNFQDTFHSVTFEWTENDIKMFLDNDESPFFHETSDSLPFVGEYYPFNEPFYLILNVASGGDFDKLFVTDTESFCHNVECSNLPIPDRGRFLIDYIEYKSID
jgi:hypothetical protein